MNPYLVPHTGYLRGYDHYQLHIKRGEKPTAEDIDAITRTDEQVKAEALARREQEE